MYETVPQVAFKRSPGTDGFLNWSDIITSFAIIALFYDLKSLTMILVKASYLLHVQFCQKGS